MISILFDTLTELFVLALSCTRRASAGLDVAQKAMQIAEQAQGEIEAKHRVKCGGRGTCMLQSMERKLCPITKVSSMLALVARLCTSHKCHTPA